MYTDTVFIHNPVCLGQAGGLYYIYRDIDKLVMHNKASQASLGQAGAMEHGMIKIYCPLITK